MRRLFAKMREATDRRVKELGGPLSSPKGPLSVSTPPHPKAAATVANRPGADGFSSLLGGSLRGWSGDPKFWSMNKGVLTGKADGTLKRNHFITWKAATVRNFDLKVKVRVSSGGNSGIQYRSTHLPELGLDALTGYQCGVVAGKTQYNGMLYEEKGSTDLSPIPGKKWWSTPRGTVGLSGGFEVKENFRTSGMNTEFSWRATVTVH